MTGRSKMIIRNITIRGNNVSVKDVNGFGVGGGG